MFLDWMMPSMSGLDVLKYVRSSLTKGSLPVIMQTAEASDLERREGIAAGADYYLSK